MQNKINIMGININVYDKTEILKLAENFINSSGQHYLVTPNPEIILKAMNDEEYFTILNLADLSIPDGIGLKFAGWCLGFNLKRITGSDLTRELLESAETKNRKIGIINWAGGLSSSEDINLYLNKNFPNLKFLVIDLDKTERGDFREMDSFGPQILFVGLGAPWQEKFMYHELRNMPTVKIALGIGGTFDFLTGKTIRAPKIMRYFGFEWLWRLVKQPTSKLSSKEKKKRIQRIFRAVFVFPYKFVRWRFVYPFLYRQNVACWLYRKNPQTSSGLEVLLVERRGEEGHWQIPQGGTDGLGLIDAGIKELEEELGNDKFVAKGVFPNINKYRFYNPGSVANYRGGIYLKHAGYKGQKQGLFVAEFLGKDEDIKINFWDHSAWLWIDLSKVVSRVHRSRKKSMEVFLEKFKEIDKS